MPFCTRYGGEVLTTDRYCPNCGQTVERRMTSLDPQWGNRASPTGSKSPGGAVALNFFFPGLRYVYVGLGGDTGETILGDLVFVFYFIGFEIGYPIDLLTYVPSTTPVNDSRHTALILLAFLLPFAFAHDGYRKAKSR